MQQKSELPEGWVNTIISEVGKITTGNTPPKKDLRNYGNEYPWVKPGDLDKNIPITETEECLSEKGASLARLLPTNTVLVSCIGNLGKVGIAGTPLATNQQINSISFEKTIVYPKYGYYYCKTLKKWLEDNSSATTIPIINKTRFSEAPFYLPPLAEQHRIVSAIEALFFRLDAANEKLDSVLGILKKFRESVLATACDGRLTKDWRTENPDIEDAFDLLNQIINERSSRDSQKEKETKKSITLYRQKKLNDEPFEIPEKWIWIIWNDIVDWITYGFTRPMPHVEEGIPIITAKNVQNGYIDCSVYDMTTEKAFSELSDKDKPKLNEILIVKDGATIGRAAIVDIESAFCINQSVALLRFGGMTAYIPFLLKVIQSKFTQDLIWANAKGSAMPHISITKFGKLPLPLPPLLEQQEIVRRVDALFAFADSIESNVAAAREKTEKLRQSILAKAFSGQLVETEAEIARKEGRDYETAEILLEKIKADKGNKEKKR